MLRLGPIANAVLRAGGWASVLLLTVCCRAQQSQTPVFTLKVYANLVQVPTLVLGHDHGQLPRIKFGRFLVSWMLERSLRRPGYGSRATTRWIYRFCSMSVARSVI